MRLASEREFSTAGGGRIAVRVQPGPTSAASVEPGAPERRPCPALSTNEGQDRARVPVWLSATPCFHAWRMACARADISVGLPRDGDVAHGARPEGAVGSRVRQRLGRTCGFRHVGAGTGRDSVDLRIQASGLRRPALDLQLKATSALDQPQDGFLRFRLTAKNYRDLRVETQTPRLLVVFELPADESAWMTVTGEELVLRRKAYWLSLQQGFAEDAGQQTVTVPIPEHNLFDVDGLQELIERSRKGEI